MATQTDNKLSAMVSKWCGHFNAVADNDAIQISTSQIKGNEISATVWPVRTIQ